MYAVRGPQTSKVVSVPAVQRRACASSATITPTYNQIKIKERAIRYPFSLETSFRTGGVEGKARQAGRQQVGTAQKEGGITGALFV